MADFTGDNRDQRGFLAWLSLVLAECLRVTTPGGHLLVFSDWRQVPVTSDADAAPERDRERLRQPGSSIGGRRR